MSITYYDGILAGIGFLLFVGGAVATLTTPMAIIAFMVVAMVLTAHALFMSPLAEEFRGGPQV